MNVAANPAKPLLLPAVQEQLQLLHELLVSCCPYLDMVPSPKAQCPHNYLEVMQHAKGHNACGGLKVPHLLASRVGFTAADSL